jgi:hypothetical protein
MVFVVMMLCCFVVSLGMASYVAARRLLVTGIDALCEFGCGNACCSETPVQSMLLSMVRSIRCNPLLLVDRCVVRGKLRGCASLINSILEYVLEVVRGLRWSC